MQGFHKEIGRGRSFWDPLPAKGGEGWVGGPLLVDVHNRVTENPSRHEAPKWGKKLGQNGQMKIVSFASNKICEKYYQIITSDI